MDRWACVDVPQLPLQLLLRDHGDWRELPAAVVDADKPSGVVLWANATARRLRVLPGLRYATALSLCRELRAGVVGDGEVARALEQVAAELRAFTPSVEAARDEPGIYWLDASGLEALYPSLATWAAGIRGRLAQQAQLEARVVVGWTRFGTYALAKIGHAGVVETGELEEILAGRVPLAALPFAPATRDALVKLGVTTVGDFVALPAGDLRERFGDEVCRLHALAAGVAWRPLKPEIVEPPCRERVVIDVPEDDLTRLLFLVKSRLAGLLAALAVRHRGVAALVLRLRTETKRQVVCTVKPAKPTLAEEQLVELARLRLEAQGVEAAVTELELELETLPVDPEQAILFEEHARRPAAAATAAARAFARLRAELGDQAVVRAVLTNAHLPEARFRWEPLVELPPRPRPAPATRALVARLQRQLVALPTPPRDPRHAAWLPLGIHAGPVVDAQGPHVVSGGWWVRELGRDYYFVTLQGGAVLWVFFDHRRRRWFLQGFVE